MSEKVSFVFVEIHPFERLHLKNPCTYETSFQIATYLPGRDNVEICPLQKSHHLLLQPMDNSKAGGNVGTGQDDSSGGVHPPFACRDLSETSSCF